MRKARESDGVCFEAVIYDHSVILAFGGTLVWHGQRFNGVHVLRSNDNWVMNRFGLSNMTCISRGTHWPHVQSSEVYVSSVWTITVVVTRDS